MERNNYEQMTLPGLKNLARERELTRYSRLRKSELIRRLREQSILEWDNDAKMTNVPFLTPTRILLHHQHQHQHHHQTLLKI